jgi:hypothetical protein
MDVIPFRFDFSFVVLAVRFPVPEIREKVPKNLRNTEFFDSTRQLRRHRPRIFAPSHELRRHGAVADISGDSRIARQKTTRRPKLPDAASRIFNALAL